MWLGRFDPLVTCTLSCGFQACLEYDLGDVLTALLADVACTLLIFVFSFCFNNTSFYDAYWCDPFVPEVIVSPVCVCVCVKEEE